LIRHLALRAESRLSLLLSAIGGADEAFVLSLASRRRPALDRAARLFAHAGRGGLFWIALALVLSPRKRKRRMRTAIATGASVTCANLLSVAAARIAQRARPCQKKRGVALIECPSGPSMPSDQAAASFAGAAALSTFTCSTQPLLHCLAGAIASSRVYAGLHYPSDVLAGAALGHVVASIICGRASA
jgi:undecaprenyl-diphosphatase